MIQFNPSLRTFTSESYNKGFINFKQFSLENNSGNPLTAVINYVHADNLTSAITSKSLAEII